jgi:hypothetical protein
VNVTLAVSPLGQGINWQSSFIRYLVYACTASIAGGLTGFVFTALIYLPTFWIPQMIKIWFLVSLSILFSLHEARIFTISLPGNKWQIPSSWLVFSPTRNMMLWGFFLGAGSFTYIPYSNFYFIFLYLGLLMDPQYGFLFGLIYGFSRTLPTLMINSLRGLNKIKDHEVVSLIWNKKSWFHFTNIGMLLSVATYLILKAIVS